MARSLEAEIHAHNSVLLIVGLAIGSAQTFAQSEVFSSQTVIVAQQPDNSFIAAPNQVTKPKVVDRKFLLLTGVAAAATVLDVATSSHCISTYATCQEGNPLVGSRPSAAKLYGISFSVLAGEMLASAWLRREMAGRKLWMIPPIAATAEHGIAAAFNLRTMHQLGEFASP